MPGNFYQISKTSECKKLTASIRTNKKTSLPAWHDTALCRRSMDFLSKVFHSIKLDAKHEVPVYKLMYILDVLYRADPSYYALKGQKEARLGIC